MESDYSNAIGAILINSISVVDIFPLLHQEFRNMF